MKEYTKMKKIFCDFCEKEISESTHTVQRTVTYAGKQIVVEVKLSSPDKRRFAHDVCESCVYKIVQNHSTAAAEQPSE